MNTPFCNIHTHKFIPNRNIQIINQDIFANTIDNQKFSIGIYPLSVMQTDINKSIADMLRKLHLDNCLAVGEVGIDRRGKEYLQKQKEVFIKMHSLADDFDKPLIIHCVRAWSDLLSIRKELKTNRIWMFHGFNANLQIANKLIEKDCCLSFGKALLYNENLQNVFKKIPNEMIFLETDDDDISIEEVYAKASELKNLNINELKNIIYDNFVRIFEKNR